MVSGALILVSLLVTGVVFALPISSSARAQSASPQPICADVAASPVIRDTGYYPINASNGVFSGFATMFTQPSVISINGHYVMWMTGAVNSTAGIYRADSVNGLNWTISATPVLQKGPAGTWDDQSVLYPNVLWNGSAYLMYYVGNGDIAPFPNSNRLIGVAISADGTNWIKYNGNPIITHGPGLYDARYTRSPSVIKAGNTYMLWYAGSTNLSASAATTIDLAASKDGLHWTKYIGNPVFSGFRDNSSYVIQPSVVKVNDSFVMAFSDYGNSKIGYATSSDGIIWSLPNGGPILTSLAGGHNGTTYRASLLVQGQTILMWYTGESVQTSTKSTGVGGIWFATCHLLLVQNIVTSTTTQTTSITVTNTVTSTTVTTTATATTTVTTALSTGIPTYDISPVVLGGLLAVALAALLLSRRKPI
jgi:hypothetical protein